MLCNYTIKHKLHKNLIIIALVVIVLVFSCCDKGTKNIDFDFQKTNYNNIYSFVHSGLWIDNNIVYYAKSELYSTGIYYIDQSEKHKIVSDYTFGLLTKNFSQGEISSDVQAYGDNVFFWFVKEDGIRELYKYSKTDKKCEKVHSVNNVINHWAVWNDFLIYSVFTKDNVNPNSLWIYNFSKDKVTEISNSITAFGIAQNEVRYIHRDDNGKNNLYGFNFEELNSRLICAVEGMRGDYNSYNFTEDFVINVYDSLCVLNIKDGKLNKYALPARVNFFNCYGEYAFISTENSIYRINIQSGETQLLYDKFSECNLIYALSESCCVAINYNCDSPIRTSVKAYIIKSNGEIKEFLNI